VIFFLPRSYNPNATQGVKINKLEDAQTLVIRTRLVGSFDRAGETMATFLMSQPVKGTPRYIGH
jgi:hypothetical protein